MILKKKYEKELSTLAANVIKERSNVWSQEVDGGLYGFLKSNLLVGTITLNTKGITLPTTLHRASALCLNVMRGQYLEICRNLLGPHYNRNREIRRQPVTVAFVDLESETRRVGRYSQGSNPHPHFVMLFHPTTNPTVILEAGTCLNGRYRLKTKDRRISTFDLERFNPDKGSLEKLSTYISKTACHPAFSYRDGDLFALYPDRYAGERAHLSFAARSLSGNSVGSGPNDALTPELERVLDELCR